MLFNKVEAAIQAELGAPPDVIYAKFERAPRASASISQAHAARLDDGTPVIVKVQRPGVAVSVEQDPAVLADLAHLAATRTSLRNLYDTDRIGYDKEYSPILTPGQNAWCKQTKTTLCFCQSMA